MNRIEVENKIKIYAVDGEQEDGKLAIRSHWNNGERVVVCIGNHEYEIYGKDAIAAIENAMRAG